MDRLIRYVIYALLVPIVIGVFPAENGQAQSDITISIAMPQFIAEFFTEDLFADFEAAHLGVKVHVMKLNQFGFPMNTDVEEYLDSVKEWVSAADVVPVDNNLAPEATRAGYLLDLSPLVRSDTSLNSSDFYSGLWQSFQWDGGMWALPVAGDSTMLFYNRQAFDEAGLTYPSADWTMADLDNAIRRLTQYNPDGTVSAVALQNLDATPELLLSLLGEGVVDDALGVPRYDNPALEELLTTWAQLDADGLLSLPGGMMIVSGDNSIPIIIARSAFGNFSNNLVTAPLPGGNYGITANGLAVSSGTQHPELSYALVKYLANHPQVASMFFGSVPARRDLQAVELETGGIRFAGANNRSPEVTAAVEEALENGISLSEARFSDDLTAALSKMREDALDARTALQETESAILERLQIAEGRRGTQIVVATPPPPVQVAEGEITLKLGVTSNMMPFPNEDVWKTAVADFAASDPEVGLVEFDTPMARDTSSLASSYDCFYTPNNIIPEADLSQLRSLDPLLNGDPDYNPDDMVGNVMAQMQREGQTWGFPAMIQPQAMRYNSMLFEQAGVPLPNGQWTIEEFELALRMLKAHTNEPPFIPRSFGSSHLIMLIASYGGVIDPQTNTPDLSNPATIEAMRQVLNLAKDGLMDYETLAQSGGGAAMRVVMIGDNESNPTALYTELLNGFAFGRTFVETGDGGAAVNPNKLVTFPLGSRFAAVSYDVSAFYISAQTQHASACYRLIDHLTRSSDLFPAMPVRRSQIQSLGATQGEDAVAFYSALEELMRQPDTVILQTAFGGGSPAAFLGQYWLNRAFDRYVLEDGDLDSELSQARTYTAEYQACTADIPTFNPAENRDFQAYIQQFTDCASQVDPSYGS